jgi:hypothetical protein
MATVKVESLRYHTYDAVERPEGTIYEAEEQYVETLEALGMVKPMIEPSPQPMPPPPPRHAGR